MMPLRRTGTARFCATVVADIAGAQTSDWKTDTNVRVYQASNPADLEGDGSVSASDLLFLLVNWG